MQKSKKKVMIGVSGRIPLLVQCRWPSRRRVWSAYFLFFFEPNVLPSNPGRPFPCFPFLSFFLSALMAILSVRFFCLAAMLAATCFLRSSHSFLLLTFSCSTRLTAFFSFVMSSLTFAPSIRAPALCHWSFCWIVSRLSAGRLARRSVRACNFTKACFGSEAVLSFLETFTGASASAEKATVVMEGAEGPSVCGFEENTVSCTSNCGCTNTFGIRSLLMNEQGFTHLTSIPRGALPFPLLLRLLLLLLPLFGLSPPLFSNRRSPSSHLK